MAEQNVETKEPKQEVAQNIVTNVKIYPFKEGPHLGHLKGFATIEVFGALSIRGLRIMEGVDEGNYFVSYPIDPFFKGEDYRYIVEPLNDMVKQAINAAVIGKYQEFLNS